MYTKIEKSIKSDFTQKYFPIRGVSRYMSTLLGKQQGTKYKMYHESLRKQKHLLKSSLGSFHVTLKLAKLWRCVTLLSFSFGIH